MTSATAPGEHDGPARREHLVRAATDVFSRLGYAGASLRELAAAAGMEKGHLTYYFPNKESLLFEIVADLHRRFLTGIATWSTEEEPGDALLLHVGERHLDLVFAAVAPTRVAYDNFRFLTGPRRDEIVDQRRSYERTLGDVVDRSRAVTAIAEEPTTVLTKVLLAQLNWPYQWFRPDRGTPTGLSRTLAERALASLRPVVVDG